MVFGLFIYIYIYIYIYWDRNKMKYTFSLRNVISNKYSH